MTEDETKNVANNGGYTSEDVLWHQHSNHLLIELMKHFKKDVAVLDLGCGHNWYSNTLKFLGYDSMGVDSVKLQGVDVIADITDGQMQKLFGALKRNVLSLEVGEHIPAELADGYLDNVCMFGGDVCISWAVPGQAGIGHINCQDNKWVIEQMYKRGYAIQPARTEALRAAVANCHCSWFKNTLMYFAHK